MSDRAYAEASPEDKEDFIQCGSCGVWMDCRCLDEVFEHEVDHEKHPDIQYSGSTRVEGT